MKPAYLWIYRVIAFFLPETRCFGLKAQLLRLCGARVGENVRISSSCQIYGTGDLEVGDDVWIGAGCFLMATAPAKITIGSQCDFGPQVAIVTGTHAVDRNGGGHIAGEGMSLSVSVDDGCWLGARSLVLPGVSLKKRTLVAAGSVVVRSNESTNELLAGTPAISKKIYN